MERCGAACVRRNPGFFPRLGNPGDMEFCYLCDFRLCVGVPQGGAGQDQGSYSRPTVACRPTMAWGEVCWIIWSSRSFGGPEGREKPLPFKQHDGDVVVLGVWSDELAELLVEMFDDLLGGPVAVLEDELQGPLGAEPALLGGFRFG